MLWIDPVALSQEVVLNYRALNQLLAESRERPDVAPSTVHLRKRIERTRHRFDQLRALPEHTPLRDLWIRTFANLLLRFHTLAARAEMVRARYTQTHTIVELGKRSWSVDGLLTSVVREGDPHRREQGAVALEKIVSDVTDSSARWIYRRHFVVDQEGLGDLESIETPLSGELTAETLATRVLERTDEMFEQQLSSTTTWQDAAYRLGAYDAIYGWPVKLSSRWVVDTLLHPGMLDGLPPPRSLKLPKPLNGASFLLAAQQVGAAYWRALASDESVPVAWQYVSFQPLSAAYGALLASLLASPAFVHRRQRVSRHVAAEQSRVLATTMLAHLRSLALQSIVLSKKTAYDMLDVYAGRASRTMGAAIPQRLFGVVPRLRSTCTTEMVGALLAAKAVDEAVRQYDEDWFDNPRCHAWLREGNVMGDVDSSFSNLDRELDELVAWFEERLDI